LSGGKTSHTADTGTAGSKLFAACKSGKRPATSGKTGIDIKISCNLLALFVDLCYTKRIFIAEMLGIFWKLRRGGQS
jgi:hypothetical protein